MVKPATRTIGLVGLFDHPDALIAAAKGVRDSGQTRWDCHTPYPVHGLEGAMGLKDSQVPRISIGAAFTGLLAAILLTWGLHGGGYYPIRIGGKAIYSWQAYVPLYFELFVLFAAFATMGAVFHFCRLFRWSSPLHDSGIMKEITSDRFAIVLDSRDDKYDEAAHRALLEAAGCTDIRELCETTESEAVV